MINKLPTDAPLSAYIQNDPLLNKQFGSLLAKYKPKQPDTRCIETGLSSIPKEETEILDNHYGLLPEQKSTLIEKITMLFQKIFGFFEYFLSTNKSNEPLTSSEECLISDDDARTLDMYYQPIFGQAIKEE